MDKPFTMFGMMGPSFNPPLGAHRSWDPRKWRAISRIFVVEGVRYEMTGWYRSNMPINFQTLSPKPGTVDSNLYEITGVTVTELPSC